MAQGIAVWAEGIRAELAKRLPKQRKTQRNKLAVLVATMLHVRSANLVELAAGLPRASDRWDMGYQWISRFLANDLVCCDTVMEPFAGEILARLAETGEPIPLILDQTKASDRHQILMLSVRWDVPQSGHGVGADPSGCLFDVKRLGGHQLSMRFPKRNSTPWSAPGRDSYLPPAG